ncbi:MAG: hypothetical protein ACRDOH_32775 [Streptosporangiaceae bacterium]
MRTVHGGIFEQGLDTTPVGGIVSQDQDIVPRFRQVPPAPPGRDGRAARPAPFGGRSD